MQLEQFREKYHYSTSTTMMQQYLDAKFAHLDCLLLFRMGDFYELFFEDAQNASNALGIALTKRGKVGNIEVPMCGVPHHALETYLNKLIEAGYKIAICDQLETPEEAKKRGGYKAVIKRDVTRIITPGTVIEDSLVETSNPNYLVSITTYKSYAGICYVDLLTSEIAVINIPISEISHEIAKLAPKEIIMSEKLRNEADFQTLIQQLRHKITFQVDSFFATNKCLKIIEEFYNIHTVKAIGELTDTQISAIGSILEYLCLTQKKHLPLLPLPKIVNYHLCLSIDSATRRNLELVQNLTGSTKGSLLEIINKTITSAGSRLLYKFLSSPLTSLDAINYRLKLTEFFYSNQKLTQDLRILLKNSSDLERSLTKITMRRSSPRDILAIKNTFAVALKIKELFLNNFGPSFPPNMQNLILPLTGDDELGELIEESIRDDAPLQTSEGGFIKSSFHPKLSELTELINNGKQHIDHLKVNYQKITGIENLKIQHNNVLGLFIEVTSKQASKITGEFIHRQTTANSVRYTSSELQKLESDMVNAKSLSIALEHQIYNEVCQQVIQKSEIIRKLAACLAELDVFSNLGIIANDYEYTKPELSEDQVFEIKDGRHPIVEQSLIKVRKSFITNDCVLNNHERVWLITGPNMSGKSTFLRQNALITILAQIGSFVPAASARIGIVDKIFSRIGSGDDLSSGQSTFMVEMCETSAILAQSTEKSLIILDEVGRGTSTYDGMAIAWSVLEYIHDKLKTRCLFATHYHELTSMVNFLPALRNYTVAIDEIDETILFLHKIIAGAADKSYGIHVAELAGLPKQVTKRAKEILLKLEKVSTNQNKQIIKDQTHSLSLFDMDEQAHPYPSSKQSDKYAELIKELTNTDPDQLSPKQALERLYSLKDKLLG